MTGYNACNLLARLAEEDMSLVDLTHSWDKSNNEPLHERLHLGFVVDIAEGLFKIPTTRWKDESLHMISSAPKGLESEHASLQCLWARPFP